MPLRTAYGLTIDSEIALPELDAVPECDAVPERSAVPERDAVPEPGEHRANTGTNRSDPEPDSNDPAPGRSDPDVRVRLGTVSDTPDGPVEDGHLYRVPGGHYVSFEDIGSVLVSDGESIVVEPAGDVKPAVLRQLVLGRGLRLLLHQRGYVVLHASTAVVDGRAVAFLGESGQGKSTTAAGFYGEGHTVIADDVTPVDPDTATVVPGFQQVKLDRAAVDGVSTSLGATEATTLGRQYYDVPSEFDREPIPLARIYLLADGPEVEIEPVPPSGRPYHLMRSAASAFQSIDDEAVASSLDDCARLSSNVPVKRLERPREYDALPAVVRAVEADLDGSAEEVRSE